MTSRILSHTLFAFSASALLTTAAFTQTAPSNPATPATPAKPNQNDPAKPRVAPPAQQPRTTAAGSTDRAGMGGLNSLEGRWNVTIRTTGGSNATMPEVRGTSTRTWMLDDSILREDFKVNTIGSPTGVNRDPNNPNMRDPKAPIVQEPARAPGDTSSDRNRDPNQVGNKNYDRDASPSLGDIQQDFEGFGLFSFDPSTNQVSHVWADSMKPGLMCCSGTFDSSSRTITFVPHHDNDKSYDTGRPVLGSGTGSNSSDRPGNGNMDRDRNDNHNDADRARTNNPAGTSSGRNADARNPVVTLRIISDTQHVVTMTKPDHNGQALTYEITYTKEGATAATPASPRTGTGASSTSGSGSGNNERP